MKNATEISSVLSITGKERIIMDTLFRVDNPITMKLHSDYSGVKFTLFDTKQTIPTAVFYFNPKDIMAGITRMNSCIGKVMEPEKNPKSYKVIVPGLIEKITPAEALYANLVTENRIQEQMAYLDSVTDTSMRATNLNQIEALSQAIDERANKFPGMHEICCSGAYRNCAKSQKLDESQFAFKVSHNPATGNFIFQIIIKDKSGKPSLSGCVITEEDGIYIFKTLDERRQQFEKLFFSEALKRANETMEQYKKPSDPQ